MFRRSKSKGQRAVKPAVGVLVPGTPAPDLNLPSSTGREISLSNYRGQPVVLVFYPANFSPVCGDQLALYNEIAPLFEGHNAQMLAISVDGIWCHQAFAEQRSLRFPLLADFEPKGAVAQTYGVYDEDLGIARRALFVIDAQGTVRWSYVSPSDVNPGAEGILHALETLNT